MGKITRRIIENYLECPYKGYLKLTEHSIAASTDDTASIPDPSPTPVTGLRPTPNANHVSHSVRLERSELRKSANIILDAVYETDAISLCVEGLNRAEGSSDLGDFHYEPCLTRSGSKVTSGESALLDVEGVVLSRVQGRIPERGIAWTNPEAKGKSTTIRLSPGLKRGERILDALEKMRTHPPMLTLNRHCQACEFQTQCRNQAIEEDNLSLLRGISETEINRLRKRGIFTINQLSYTFRPRRIKKRAKNPAHPHYFALQAQALRERKVFVHGTPKIGEGPRIFMDIEGTPNEQTYYLIGLLVIDNEGTRQKSFWADHNAGEAQMFMDMLDYVRSYRAHTILHYGAYEVRALRRIQPKLSSEYVEELKCLAKRMVNVLSVIGPHIYFPVYTNSLKEIAGFLGHRWSAPNPSGAQAVLWRQQWNGNRDEVIKDKLIHYNMDDCFGLKAVVTFIDQITKSQSDLSVRPTLFVHTDHLEKESRSWGKFGKNEYVLDEFDFINRCSYFDYQRHKVAARIARPAHKPVRGGGRVKTYKNNKTIEIYASRCPDCRSRKLRPVRPLKQQVVDLRLSGAAVRRWVVLYLSEQYRCLKCDRKFVPDGFPRNRTRFGKRLLCWCMYQVFIGGQNMMRLRDGLGKMFGIFLPVPTTYRFKQIVSAHYKEIYAGIARSMMDSPVIYIDETNVNLRSETGYVWCITDGRSVHYFYKSSREGSFLMEMFRDFKGVLVSDFYTAYDSLSCRHQRCLVHLMRDFNEEMQRHPFDSELRLLAERFSAVLYRAVTTIDRYGFRRRHLAKHMKEARDFLRWASSYEFASTGAEKLRSRISKYHDQIYTFMEFDDISWNNTNAEHYIKPFAKHRSTANGKFTTRSIDDYLTLLSIAETCKGNGRDFLDFLMKNNEDSISFRSGRHASSGKNGINATGVINLM